MTVLLDTSVLLHAQKLPETIVARRVAGLLATGEAAVPGPVIMEYMRGARTPDQLDFLRARIASVDFLVADQRVWTLAGTLAFHLRRTGKHLPDPDVLVAATAIRYDVPLYTLDKGFDRIPDLKLYQPPDVKETPGS